MKPEPPPPVKLKVYYRALITDSQSVSPLWLKKETILEVPFSNNPMSTFINSANHEGYVFLEIGKPTMFHNILHVELA